MASHPFLKSIRPVNLLSFGPNTEEIDLRQLNILIGPNGSGKSNLIDIFGLLSKLPEREPWDDVIRSGGASEWTWKGKEASNVTPSLAVTTPSEEGTDLGRAFSGHEKEKGLYFSISLQALSGGFVVADERFHEFDHGADPTLANGEAFVREDDNLREDRIWQGPGKPTDSSMSQPRISASRSALSMVGASPYFAASWPRMPEFARSLSEIVRYRDWTFGVQAKFRGLQPVGLDSYRLASDSINLAQVLKAMRDRGDSKVFERLLELMRSFYAPVKDVDTELVGTYLRIMIKEEGLSSRTPAERLSDGTLRWLMLLIILLDPTPPPLICIDEPDLGLHPDMIPTLADLLRDASTRTQLVITTHSTGLVDAFSDTPEVVCVCEKVVGATEVKRLDKSGLKIWLEKYSLGDLWTSGQIGGNRW